jgi:hypothetical protein
MSCFWLRKNPTPERGRGPRPLVRIPSALAPKHRLRIGTHFPRGFGVLVEPVPEGLVVADKGAVIEQVGVAVQLLGRVPMRVEVALETAQIRRGNAGPTVMAG